MTLFYTSFSRHTYHLPAGRSTFTLWGGGEQASIYGVQILLPLEWLLIQMTRAKLLSMKKYFVLFNVASRLDLIYVQDIPVPINISFIPLTTL